MIIDDIKNINELDAVLTLIQKIFPPTVSDDVYKYSRNFWIDKMNELPELLLYAKDGDTVCGSVFAWNDNGGITVAHCGIDNAYRKRGLGRKLMLEIEKRVKAFGFNGIALGSVEEAEAFYEKLGYTGTLLVQSEKDSIEKLRLLNTKYEIIGTNIYDGTINQIYINLPVSDKELQNKYKEIFPESWTQMVYGKRF